MKRGRPKNNAVKPILPERKPYRLVGCVLLLGAVFSDRGNKVYVQCREMLAAASAADAAPENNFPGPPSGGTGDE